jgi:hypothetical protein
VFTTDQGANLVFAGQQFILMQDTEFNQLSMISGISWQNLGTEWINIPGPNFGPSGKIQVRQTAPYTFRIQGLTTTNTGAFTGNTATFGVAVGYQVVMNLLFLG